MDLMIRCEVQESEELNEGCSNLFLVPGGADGTITGRTTLGEREVWGDA